MFVVFSQFVTNLLILPIFVIFAYFYLFLLIFTYFYSFLLISTCFYLFLLIYLSYIYLFLPTFNYSYLSLLISTHLFDLFLLVSTYFYLFLLVSIEIIGFSCLHLGSLHPRIFPLKEIPDMLQKSFPN